MYFSGDPRWHLKYSQTFTETTLTESLQYEYSLSQSHFIIAVHINYLTFVSISEVTCCDFEMLKRAVPKNTIEEYKEQL